MSTFPSPAPHSRTRARTGRTLAAAALALLVAGCGGGAPGAAEPPTPAAPDPLDAATTEQLYEQARTEGRVAVYSFTSRIAAVEAEFERTYPGVDLVPTDISSTEQIARLRAEADAGAPGADVAYLSDAPVVLDELLGDGVVRNYVPPRLTESLPPEFREPLIASRLSTKTLMYNEEAHPQGSPVTNLWELTDPQWTGRVVMVDPQVRGDYLDLMTEIVLRSEEMDAAHQQLRGAPVTLDDGIENAGEQWIADLYANGVVLVGDTDDVNAAVGQRGQAAPPVGFTTYSDRRDNEDEDRALQAATGVAPAPGIAFPALIGITRDSPNPAAARLLVDFLMGDDSPTGGPGFDPFYVAGDYPTRTDVVPPEGAFPLAQLGTWTIDPAASAERRRDVADLLLTLG